MVNKLEKGDRVGGFICSGKQNITEVNGTLFEFEHEDAGSKLFYLQTGDKNKLFSVGFKTVPKNDTGVFHILEHSVLCGSEKFPVKEPFVELMKGSMNTFLNAMTFPDKTLYPVSSRNEKDFLNLTEVYLDAVFKPAIYKNPNIFRQEGWHYELRDEKDEASLKGVVFNEMKGTEADAGRLIHNEMQRILYKESCYYYVSGGTSASIPTLSYEEFLDAHRKYYHPGNAIFYLEGDLDITKPVALMEEYLKGVSKPADKIEIVRPAKAKACTVVKEYPVAEDEDIKNRTYVTFGKLMYEFSRKNDIYGAYLISEYLTDSNEAPLKKLILENNLGQDVTLAVEDGIVEGYLLLKITNTEANKTEEIKQKILELVRDLAKKGLDKKALEATLNQTEFAMKEVSEPRSLYHNLQVLSSYLYGGDPALYLTFDDSFAFLREQIKTDYYEKLLLEMFDEEELVTLIMKPSKTLSLEREKKEKEKVKKAQASWSKEQVQDILSINESLDHWQQTEDTKEQIATIPRLAVADVDPLPQEYITKELLIEGKQVLLHPMDVSGISYISMYFPVPAKYENQMESLSLLTDLYEELATKRPLLELLSDIKMNLGELSFDLSAIATEKELDSCTAYFEIKCSVLNGKLEEALRLIKEVVFDTDFTRKTEIRDYLLQVQQQFRNSIISNGHQMGMKNSASSFTVQNTLQESIDGITCYQFIKELNNDFEQRFEDFAATMQGAIADIFVRDQMILSFTCHAAELEKEDFEKTFRLKDFLFLFPEKGQKENTKMTRKLPYEACTFVQIPSAVSYASAACNLNRLGDEYSGAWRVATKIISLSYLWNEVRVKGGAYGVGLAVGPAGNLSYYSYRDPSGERSLSKYRESGSFLKEFLESEGSFTSFIISSIATTEPLLSPKEEADFADMQYLRGMGYAHACRIRKELLELKEDELVKCCEILDKMWEKASVCVIGKEEGSLEVTKRITL